ncbi:MAG: hypothetical protein RMM28_08330 [Thermoleophilia bacterium]|nr:hypothetical protein [Gaiellaceae bacterium]MDW8339128.1 hypothetical protein [Thermoleophilia bacterium]
MTALFLAYTWSDDELWGLPRRWDVAVLAALVLPASTALVWLALPLALRERRHPIALPALAGVAAVALGLLGLESPFTLAKLAAFCLVGFAVLWAFHALWWITLVAALVAWVDVWSVATGPTRHLIEERPGLIEQVAVGFPVPGEASVLYLGPPDIIFFALFLGAAARFGLRVGATWVAMTGFLSLTLAVVVLADISGLPALPAVCAGFLLPNADLLLRDARAAWRARGSRRAA